MVEEVNKTITIRMPESLHKRLQEHANKDRRSLNAEALVLLDQAMSDREEGKRKEDRK